MPNRGEGSFVPGATFQIGGIFDWISGLKHEGDESVYYLAFDCEYGDGRNGICRPYLRVAEAFLEEIRHMRGRAICLAGEVREFTKKGSSRSNWSLRANEVICEYSSNPRPEQLLALNEVLIDGNILELGQQQVTEPMSFAKGLVRVAKLPIVVECSTSDGLSQRLKVEVPDLVHIEDPRQDRMLTGPVSAIDLGSEISLVAHVHIGSNKYNKAIVADTIKA